MSRFMQIRIQLEPVYRPRLKAHFPRLAGALEELGAGVDDRKTTLCGIIQGFERAMDGEIRPALKEVLERHLKVLRPLQRAVEEKLAAWQLEGLDELLYRIEDAIEDLERDLD